MLPRDITESYIRSTFDIDKERQTRKKHELAGNVDDFAPNPFNNSAYTISVSPMLKAQELGSYITTLTQKITAIAEQAAKTFNVPSPYKVCVRGDQYYDGPASLDVYLSWEQLETDKEVITRLRKRERARAQKKLEQKQKAAAKKKREELEYSTFLKLEQKYGKHKRHA